METHFLADSVEGESSFSPGGWYNRDGDCIEFCTADEAVVGDRIDEVFTVYRSAIDNRLIGFQIKGVRAILDRMDASHMKVEARREGDIVRSVKVEIVFLAAVQEAFRHPGSVRNLPRYAELLPILQHSAEHEEMAICTATGA